MKAEPSVRAVLLQDTSSPWRCEQLASYVLRLTAAAHLRSTRVPSRVVAHGSLEAAVMVCA
jgi:hypothetical protein